MLVTDLLIDDLQLIHDVFVQLCDLHDDLLTLFALHRYPEDKLKQLTERLLIVHSLLIDRIASLDCRVHLFGYAVKQRETFALVDELALVELLKAQDNFTEVRLVEPALVFVINHTDLPHGVFSTKAKESQHSDNILAVKLTNRQGLRESRCSRPARRQTRQP